MAGALLLLVTGYVLLRHKYNWWPSSKNIVQVSDKNNTHNTTVRPSPKNNNVPEKTEIASDKTTNQVPTGGEAVATITQLEQQGDNVLIAMKVERSNTGGSCVVTFTNPNDRPVNKEFSSTSKGEAVSCSTSIPAYEFSYLGVWHVTVRYYLGEQQVVTEGDIKIS